MNPLNIATKGYLGNTQCIVTHGYICGPLVDTWFEVLRFVLYVSRSMDIMLER